METNARLSLLRSAFATDPTMVLTLEPNGEFVAMNAAAEAFACDLSRNIPMRTALIEATRDAVRHNKTSLETGDLRLTATKLSTETDEPDPILLRVIREPEAPQIAEPELLELLRNLLVHDLRSLLQSVLAALEEAFEPTTGQETSPPPDQSEARDAIYETLAQVSRLLSIVSGRAGNWLNPVGVDLEEVLSEVVTRLTPIARQRNIHLRLTSARQAVGLKGPAILLHELSQNMVDNAIKYGSGDVEVRLEQHLLRAGEWEVKIEVWQAGSGVSDLLLEALCKEPKDVAIGHGQKYGLQIMRLAMRGLNGSWENEIIAGRSCLRARFSLPESTMIAPQGHRPVDAQPNLMLSGKSLIVVEDNDLIRSWAGKILRNAGAEVCALKDAESALSFVRGLRKPVDAAIIDITLPGMDGFALAQRLAHLPSSAKPRVVLGLSGNVDEASRARAHSVGIAQLLEKPILAQDLTRILESATTAGKGAMHKTTHGATTDHANGSDLFDEEIRTELLADLGEVAALDFMKRALKEAVETHNALTTNGYGYKTRPLIHSAIGSSGMTGLKAVETALRCVQLAAGKPDEHEAACATLGVEIDRTRQALS
ncbi:hybrid sensor histidine kinase/response regulator [Thioclava sp. JE_KL1]|uniref:ATP-binding response regulator n=1 Tax=Thioclava sp. JE_KL1 TaxID=2651187 RepID=UPI00128C5D10|nr:response regulator [Thioclava sp. JE_KL1]MPQ96172.1 response regulator [Thioclava sp. JE_KL1]